MTKGPKFFFLCCIFSINDNQQSAHTHKRLKKIKDETIEKRMKLQ